MTVRFEIRPLVEQEPAATLVYIPHEYSFDTVPSPDGFTSVLINSVSLEIDESHRVVFVWGYCPHTAWVASSLEPPAAPPGALFVADDPHFLRGASVSVIPHVYLPVFNDPISGWIKIDGGLQPASAVRLFPGVIVELDARGQFSSLWLKPHVEQ
jgi:hypothetical protein